MTTPKKTESSVVTLTLEELAHYTRRLLKVCPPDSKTNVVSYTVDTTVQPNKITLILK